MQEVRGSNPGQGRNLDRDFYSASGTTSQWIPEPGPNLLFT